MRPTTEENRRLTILNSVDNILGSSRLRFEVKTLSLQEDLELNMTAVECAVREILDEVCREVTFSGSSSLGPVNALFASLQAHYQDRFKSLKNLRFKEFTIEPRFLRGASDNSGSEVISIIEFQNKKNKTITFRKKKNSFVAGSINCLFDAVEFYMNSELAFKRGKFLIEEARARNRGDIADKYMTHLSNIVQIVNCEGFI